jgi:hypothetical protein
MEAIWAMSAELERLLPWAWQAERLAAALKAWMP